LEYFTLISHITKVDRGEFYRFIEDLIEGVSPFQLTNNELLGNRFRKGRKPLPVSG
tara:strand:+ start:176 stop:343 length:168 start_codon:yes stop_codon:yes gene_type:complete